jgi:hypothetical protein
MPNTRPPKPSHRTESLSNIENQQDAKITVYWSPRSAQHVSGKVLPIFRSARLRFFTAYGIVSCCGRQGFGARQVKPLFSYSTRSATLPRSEPLPITTTGHYTICCKKYQSCAPEDGQKIARNMLSWSWRSINCCCISLVFSITLPTLMMHGQTQINRKFVNNATTVIRNKNVKSQSKWRISYCHLTKTQRIFFHSQRRFPFHTSERRQIFRTYLHNKQIWATHTKRHKFSPQEFAMTSCLGVSHDGKCSETAMRYAEHNACRIFISWFKGFYGTKVKDTMGQKVALHYKLGRVGSTKLKYMHSYRQNKIQRSIVHWSLQR